MPRVGTFTTRSNAVSALGLAMRRRYSVMSLTSRRWKNDTPPTMRYGTRRARIASSRTRDCACVRIQRIAKSPSPRRPRHACTKDPLGDELGLGALVDALLEPQQFTTAPLGPQGLGVALAVLRDHRVGRVEDDAGRAVVLLELDHRRVGVIAVEAEEVFRLGAAPAVDRLVVIPDDAQVAAHACQVPHQGVLHAVGVLELVDEDVLVTVGEPRADLGILAQRHDLEQEVVEIAGVLALEALGVEREHPPGHIIDVVTRRQRAGILTALRQRDRSATGPRAG